MSWQVRAEGQTGHRGRRQTSHQTRRCAAAERGGLRCRRGDRRTAARRAGGTTGPPIAARSCRQPDAVAVESAYRRLTWAELEEESARLAAGYLSLGLEPGDRLASLMPNRVALVVHYLACFKAGLVATPLNYRYTAREIDHALSVSTAAALVAHGERAADIADLRACRLAPSRHRGVPRRTR